MDYDRHNVINFIIIMFMAVIMISWRVRACSEFVFRSSVVLTVFWLALCTEVQANNNNNMEKKKSDELTQNSPINFVDFKNSTMTKRMTDRNAGFSCEKGIKRARHSSSARLGHVIDEIIFMKHV